MNEKEESIAEQKRPNLPRDAKQKALDHLTNRTNANKTDEKEILTTSPPAQNMDIDPVVIKSDYDYIWNH